MTVRSSSIRDLRLLEQLIVDFFKRATRDN